MRPARIAVVETTCYWLASPEPGSGIAESVFVPALVTALKDAHEISRSSRFIRRQ